MPKNTILIAILLFALCIRLPALFIPHIENDEVILQVLAEKVSKNIKDYSLQGTDILSQLPASVYNKPLFHHPPFFTYALVIVRWFFGEKFQILFPILCSCLTVLIIFWIGRLLYSEFAGLIAALIFSICPIVLHASTKIWIDALLTLCCTLSVYFSILAVKKQKAVYYILAGLSFGLAVLSKISALPILLPIIYIFLKPPLKLNKPFNILYFFIFSFFVAGPWFFLFYKKFQAFFPWWIKPTQETMQMFNFIRMAIDRPIHFYFSNIIKLAPIYLFAWIAMIRYIKEPQTQLESIWALSFILGFTFVGYRGLEGYVSRYILPALPALAILSARLISLNKKYLWVISCIFMAYGLTNAILNAYIFQVADVFSLFYFFVLLK